MKEHGRRKPEAQRLELRRANWTSERSGGAKKILLAIQEMLTWWLPVSKNLRTETADDGD
jgi:hypothetical protein